MPVNRLQMLQVKLSPRSILNRVALNSITAKSSPSVITHLFLRTLLPGHA
jgi:hypothetical protein